MRHVASLHRHNDGPSQPIPLDTYIAAVDGDKRISGEAGTFTLTLLGRPLPGGGPTVDWEAEVTDDDWVTVGFDDGEREWYYTLGLVDMVERATSTARGAPETAWHVICRDLTKVFEDTEVLDMPYAQHDTALAYGAFYGAVQALSKTPAGATPGEIVQALYEYLMRAGSQRAPNARWWAVPTNLPALIAGGAEDVVVQPDQRQATDIITDEHLDPGLAGVWAAYTSLLAAPNSGGQVWDLLVEHSNPPLNELWVDLAPPLGDAYSPLAYSTAEGEYYSLRPALILRERPFPSMPGSAPHRGTANDPWKDLPATTIHVKDCTSITLTRSGDERYNYFLVESGSGTRFSRMVLAMAGIGDTPFDGVPAIDIESVQRHGLRRLEVSSQYINLATGKLDLFLGWTRLLRDWYALNPQYLSGTIVVGIPLPGVRVGERLDLLGYYEDPLQLYIEGVRIQSSVEPDGSITGSTALTVTRGHTDPVGALTAEVARYGTPGASPTTDLARQMSQMVDRLDAYSALNRDEQRSLANWVRRRDGEDPLLPLEDEEAAAELAVVGTLPDGSEFDVPDAEDG